MPEQDVSDHTSHEEQQLADLKLLLLKQERLRVQELEAETAALQAEIESLRNQLREQKESVVSDVSENMGQITQHAVDHAPGEMANALGPIIGEATRIHIRDSRDEMVEVLYPIIGDSVIKAVGEAFRDFQRTIDARLRPSRNTVLDDMGNRLRGVAPNELVLRQALPFEIEQFFLIQKESGLLLAYYSAPHRDDTADSDLISGMLTAIRDFVRDSFDPNLTSDGELDEISYGGETVVLQAGSEAYAAVVISGYEPEGFRGRLRKLLADLHMDHGLALREYAGDPESLPDLIAPIDQFRDELLVGQEGTDGESETSDDTRLLKNIGIGIGIASLFLCCFYGWFTWSLMPVALGWTTPTATHTPVPTLTATPTNTPTATPTNTPTATPTNTPTATPTNTPTATPTNTPTATPTSTPTATSTNTPTATSTNTPTATPTNTPTATPTMVEFVLVDQLIVPTNVWSRETPDLETPQFRPIPEGSYLTVLQEIDGWYNVEWTNESGLLVTGWVPIVNTAVIQIEVPLDQIEE